MQLRDRRVKKEGLTKRCRIWRCQKQKVNVPAMPKSALSVRDVVVVGICLLEVAKQAVNDADIGCENVL